MTKNSENSGNRVLLVVGDPASRTFIQRALESVLLEVEIASRFDHAVSKARSHAWALLILDPTLPKVDGLELLRDLQETVPSLLRKTIVILEPGSSLAEKIKEFPLCRTLDRPVVRQQLIHAVSDCLSQPQEPK